MLALFAAMILTAKPNALIVTHTTGYRHDNIPMSEKILASLLSDRVEVSYARNAEDVQRELAPSRLHHYRLIVFDSTTGNIGIPDMAAFLKWIEKGNGFAGIHAAANTCQPAQMAGDTRFMDMLGLNFKGHGNQCEVSLKVENRSHPSVKHLGKSWKVMDEIYLFEPHRLGSLRERAKILLSLDKHPPDGAPEAGQPGDFPLAWFRPYGKGRVFFTALGHREELWRTPEYQAHVKGGMFWAGKL